MTTGFISYTHVDTALKDQLVQHLAPLRREGLIDLWHDGCVYRSLTGAEDRRLYWDLVRTAVGTGGRVAVAATVVDGLALAAAAAEGFAIVEHGPSENLAWLLARRT